jgi:acyl-ACP thioesterase
MDMNSHINNVVYLGWGLESVPAEVYDGYELYEVGILSGVSLLEDLHLYIE